MRACAVSALIAIWVLSLMPAPPGVPGGDKLHHVLAYAGCTWLWAQVIATPTGRGMAVFAIVAMGVLIEFLQGWSGFRTFDVADMAANAVGALGGWMAARLQAILRRRYLLPRA